MNLRICPLPFISLLDLALPLDAVDGGHDVGPEEREGGVAHDRVEHHERLVQRPRVRSRLQSGEKTRKRNNVPRRNLVP